MTGTVDLSKNFSGAIGYSVVSDMPAIVSVPAIVPAGTPLTVMAGTEEGVAMVTVTASDSVDAATAKIVTDTFKVTVSSAVIPVTSGPITLDIGVKGDRVKVGAGETLKSADIQIVIVESTDKAGEYKVTAIKKGTTTLEVLKDDAVARTIAVTVNNQAPTRNKTALPTVPYELMEVVDGDPDLTPALREKLGNVALYKLVMDGQTVFEGLSTYFDDADNDGLTFTSVADRTNHVVVAGYKKDGSVIFVDMLQVDPAINLFNLVTYATDAGKPGDPLSSTKERLEVETMPPLPQEYLVVQHADNHNFIKLNNPDDSVGLRQNASHTMKFAPTITFLGAITGGPATPTAQADLVHTKPATTDSDRSWLEIVPTGGISVGTDADTLNSVTAGDPYMALKFQVTKTGPATLTLKYHQFGDHDGDDADIASTPETYFDPVIRTLRFSVVAVTQNPVAL